MEHDRIANFSRVLNYGYDGRTWRSETKATRTKRKTTTPDLQLEQKEFSDASQYPIEVSLGSSTHTRFQGLIKEFRCRKMARTNSYVLDTRPDFTSDSRKYPAKWLKVGSLEQDTFGCFSPPSHPIGTFTGQGELDQKPLTSILHQDWSPWYFHQQLLDNRE